MEEAGEAGLGGKLEIVLGESGERFVQVEISYSTSTSSSALQWLRPEQTSGGELPYVYSQCQAWMCCVFFVLSQSLNELGEIIITIRIHITAMLPGYQRKSSGPLSGHTLSEGSLLGHHQGPGQPDRPDVRREGGGGRGEW